MRILLPIFALFFLTSCATTGTPAKTETAAAPESKEARLAQRIATGEKLWERCKTCHGRDGRADTAFGATHDIPDFTSAEWRKDRVPAQMMAAISQGCGPETSSGLTRMPAQEKLDEEEVRSLITYISHLGN